MYIIIKIDFHSVSCLVLGRIFHIKYLNAIQNNQVCSYGFYFLNLMKAILLFPNFELFDFYFLLLYIGFQFLYIFMFCFYNLSFNSFKTLIFPCEATVWFKFQIFLYTLLLSDDFKLTYIISIGFQFTF